jgi:putative membrane protein
MITERIPIPPNRTHPSIIVGIIGVSVIASLFLAWLVYYHQPTDVSGTHLAFLPALNAVLNTCCTIALVMGVRYIRRGALVQHRNSMFLAFLFSSLFLASYITNHALHGDAKFPGHGAARFIYLWILLLPHILASVIALPMVLITFFFSLTGRFPLHRKIARYTYPIWLYVSVTGVIVYAMLAAYR